MEVRVTPSIEQRAAKLTRREHGIMSCIHEDRLVQWEECRICHNRRIDC